VPVRSTRTAPGAATAGMAAVNNSPVSSVMVVWHIEVFDQLGWVKVTSCANVYMLPLPED